MDGPEYFVNKQKSCPSPLKQFHFTSVDEYTPTEPKII